MARRKQPDPELVLTVEDITPAIAEDWLKFNTHNRKISDRLVLTYAETMQEGEWRLNGEPIIFDYNERLQSGQHRLLAVITAGVTIRSVVVRRAEPEAIYSLESGRRRRMTDVLTLKGETDVAALSAALSWTWRWENRLMDRGGETPTHTHQLRVLDKNPDIRAALPQGRRLHGAIGVSSGLMAAIYHQFWKINEEDAEAFWEHLATGENIASDHPAFVWRRWVIRSRQSDRRPSSATLAAVTVKAWNAYREHRIIKALSWRPEESFPEAV